MIVCDKCDKDCTNEYLTEVNPEGGFGRPRFLMCDACLEAAEKGSLAAAACDRTRMVQ
jgi:hypothetical protein